MPSGPPLPGLLTAGAGQLFVQTLGVLGKRLGEAPPRPGQVIAWLQRLADADRIAPEAALHLLAVAKALQKAGGLDPEASRRMRTFVQHTWDRLR